VRALGQIAAAGLVAGSVRQCQGSGNRGSRIRVRVLGQAAGDRRQRVVIARALSMDATVRLFDEPTSAPGPEMLGEVVKNCSKQCFFDTLGQRTPRAKKCASQIPPH